MFLRATKYKRHSQKFGDNIQEPNGVLFNLTLNSKFTNALLFYFSVTFITANVISISNVGSLFFSSWTREERERDWDGGYRWWERTNIPFSLTSQVFPLGLLVPRIGRLALRLRKELGRVKREAATLHFCFLLHSQAIFTLMFALNVANPQGELGLFLPELFKQRMSVLGLFCTALVLEVHHVICSRHGCHGTLSARNEWILKRSQNVDQ